MNRQARLNAGRNSDQSVPIHSTYREGFVKNTFVSFSLLLLMLGIIHVQSFGQAPVWDLKMDEEIQEYNFLRDGKFIFLRNGKYAWLYNSETGKKVYDLKIDDYEKLGVQTLTGERYLVSGDDVLQCFDALTGKLLWKQEYKDVSQDEYNGMSETDDLTVLRYGTMHVAVNLKTGAEVWRQKIEYNADLNKPGDNNWNRSIIGKQNKLMILGDGDELALYDLANGKKVLALEDYEVNPMLVEKQYAWYHESSDETYAMFLLDDAAVVVDLVHNKQVSKHEIKYDSDIDPLMPVASGCAVLGKNKILYFDDATGKICEVEAAAGDFRTYRIMEVAGKSIFIAGLSDKMFAIDLAAGKLLWESKKDDPQFEGYCHRYLKAIDKDILVSYGNSYMSNKGTSFTLMRINAFTGKVAFKTPEIARSSIAKPNWIRSLTNFMQKISNQQRTFGYDKLGIEYSLFEYKDNIVVGILSIDKLENPETRESGGDGCVIVDPTTGKILFKNYLPLVDYSAGGHKPDMPWHPEPILEGKYLTLLGDEGVAVYDLDAKKLAFSSLGTLKGFPEDAMIVNDVLYVKFGNKKFTVELSAAKNIFDSMGMKVKDRWDEDPYGFAAYDIKRGALLWRTETKEDPGFLTPGFSLRGNYDPATKRLYYGDEKTIYALQCRPDGGKFDYTIDVADKKIGKMPFKKTYAIQEWPIGSVSTSTSTSYGVNTVTTTTTTTASIGGEEYGSFISNLEEAEAYTTYRGWFNIWGAAAKKCLRVVYDKNVIFAMGSEGIALINSADGSVNWRHPWKYDQDNVQYMPHVYGDKLVYCVERELVCLDLATGKEVWKADEAKRPIFFPSPNGKFFYSIYEERVKGYSLQ